MGGQDRPITDAPRFDSKTAGSGDAVLTWTGSASAATVKNSGGGNFAVWVHSDSRSDLALNEIGTYSGEIVLPKGQPFSTSPPTGSGRSPPPADDATVASVMEPSRSAPGRLRHSLPTDGAPALTIVWAQ